MKAIFRILGTAAAVAATGAAIVIMDKLLNEKAAPIIESIEFPEEAEKDDAEAAKTAEAYAEGPSESFKNSDALSRNGFLWGFLTAVFPCAILNSERSVLPCNLNDFLPLLHFVLSFL